MEETMPSGYSKPHLENLSLAITCILESFPGVTEVPIKEKPPAEHHLISSWEQKRKTESSCLLSWMLLYVTFTFTDLICIFLL
uniref:Uncharacterized protein n=1 Tax=Ursus americanus TaxID=9643 RepID=A0A452QE93_URSAM